VNKRRDELKKWAVNYKGGACEYCGYRKSMRALCFHHIDPTKKEFEINGSAAAISKKLREAELDKCLLLCSNCHMEEHEKLERKQSF
jgi:hypothetical protein